MNKPFFRAAAAVLLALILTGCAPEYSQPDNTYPTLPSFPLEQTPLEQLRSAMSAAWATEEYTLCWGQVMMEEIPGGWDRTQAVTAENPPNWQSVYESMPLLELQENFPEDFCALPLRAIPSNTGIIRYQVSDLSREDAIALLYGEDRDVEFDSCDVAIEILECRFTRLELQFAVDETLTTVYLSFDYLNSD